MKFFLQPWQLSLLILADWINHREQEVIEYLDDQRRCLAVKGKILGRNVACSSYPLGIVPDFGAVAAEPTG